MNLLIFLIFLITDVSSAARKSYKGSKILEIKLEDGRDIENVLGFEPDLLGSRWQTGTAQFLIDADQFLEVDRKLRLSNISAIFRNVKDPLPIIRKSGKLGEPVGSTYIKNHYLSFDEQLDFLKNQEKQFPNKMKIEKIGQSSENRDIVSVQIGSTDPKSPAIFIDAGIHAREWISSSAALNIIDELVTNSTYSNLLEKVQVIMVPNMNPDGYEFSRNSDKMWRKTRSHPKSECPGVDGNRNYPYKWKGRRYRHECAETFAGYHALSEPEVVAVTSYMEHHKSRIGAYAALHSFGQWILYPWGYETRTYPDDVDDLIRLGNRMAEAIRSRNGSEYKVENAADGMYAASGTSDDWAKSIGIKYSYTIEMGLSWFVPPENEISNVSGDVFEAILVLIKEIAAE